MNTTKNTNRRVTFTAFADVEAVVLAKMGIGLSAICATTKLTKCQVTYRLTAAKKAEGLQKGVGYITQWRSGASPYARQVIKALSPGLRETVRQELPPLFGIKEPAVAPTTEQVKA